MKAIFKISANLNYKFSAMPLLCDILKERRRKSILVKFYTNKQGQKRTKKNGRYK